MIELISKKIINISSNELKEIYTLKDSFWKHGIIKQKKWFKKNIKNYDICNILKYNNKIIGITILRKRRYFQFKTKKKYLLFDTLIIKKKYRGKKFSLLLMNFNNFIIIRENLMSVLICENNLIKFYKKFLWKRIKNLKISFNDYNYKSNSMIFNYKNDFIKKKGILFSLKS